MEKICQNCYWKVKKVGWRGNYCLKSLEDTKLKDTCKNFLSKKVKCNC